MFEQNKTGHFWDFIVFWDIDGFGRCPSDEAFSRRAHMARMHKVGCADALGARRAGALVQREKDEGARTCAYSLFGRRSLFLFPLFFSHKGKRPEGTFGLSLVCGTRCWVRVAKKNTTKRETTWCGLPDDTDSAAAGRVRMSCWHQKQGHNITIQKHKQIDNSERTHFPRPSEERGGILLGFLTFLG